MRSTRLSTAVVGAAVVALVAGCGGSRVDHERVVAAGNGGGQSVAADGAAVDPAGNADLGPTIGGPAAPGAPGPGTAAVPGAATPGTSTGTGPGSAPGPNPAGGSAAGAGQGPKSPGGAQVAASGACAKPLAPIRLGQVTTTSGLVGSSLAGLRTGVQVWASDVNSRGGVHCHPVEVTSLDDGSDSSRVASNWNQLIKVKGAVACIACGNPIPIAALRSAAERDKVAVVGGDLTSVDWFESPYLFPQGGAPFASYDGGFVEAAKAAKGGVAGLVWCVEASICADIKNNFAVSVTRAGLKPGPVKAISITQPDYTAECKSMKDAGVTVLFVVADGAGIARLARSCASIGYQPVLASGSIGTPGSAGADPNLRKNELYLGTPVVPYLASQDSGVVEWQNAMKRFAPNQALEQGQIVGWSAGKLFEAALARVADKARAGVVTKDLVLEGLWQIKNEKLGGLSPGITFNKEKPATYVDCYYTLKISKDGFAAPNGDKLACYKPGTNTPLSNSSADALGVSNAGWSAPGVAVSMGTRRMSERRRTTDRLRRV